MNRLRAVLLGLTVVLLVVSATALLVRPSVEASGRGAAPVAASAPAVAPVADSIMADAVARVVRGNVFAPDRPASPSP